MIEYLANRLSGKLLEPDSFRRKDLDVIDVLVAAIKTEGDKETIALYRRVVGDLDKRDGGLAVASSIEQRLYNPSKGADDPQRILLHCASCIFAEEAVEGLEKIQTTFNIPSEFVEVLKRGRIEINSRALGIHVGKVSMRDFFNEQFIEPGSRKYPLDAYFNLLTQLVLSVGDKKLYEKIIADNEGWGIRRILAHDQREGNLSLQDIGVKTQGIATMIATSDSEEDLDEQLLKESGQPIAIRGGVTNIARWMLEQGLNFSLEVVTAICNPSSNEFPALKNCLLNYLRGDKGTRIKAMAVLTRERPRFIGSLYRVMEAFIDNQVEVEFASKMLTGLDDLIRYRNSQSSLIPIITSTELPHIFETTQPQAELDSPSVDEILQTGTILRRMVSKNNLTIDPEVLRGLGLKKPSSVEILFDRTRHHKGFRLKFLLPGVDDKTIIFQAEFMVDRDHPDKQFEWNILQSPEKLEREYQSVLKITKRVLDETINDLKSKLHPRRETRNESPIVTGTSSYRKYRNIQAEGVIDLPFIGTVGLIGPQTFGEIISGVTPATLLEQDINPDEARELLWRYKFDPNPRQTVFYISLLQKVGRMALADQLGIEAILSEPNQLTFLFNRRTAFAGGAAGRVAFRAQFDKEGYLTPTKNPILNSLLSLIGWELQSKTFYDLGEDAWFTSDTRRMLEEVIDRYHSSKESHLPEIRLAAATDFGRSQIFIPVSLEEYGLSVLAVAIESDDK